jgi:hypothetical protein
MPYTKKKKNRNKIMLRRSWHRLQTPESKRPLNVATQELKLLLISYKNNGIQTFLQGLTPTESTDYSLWKTIKKIKQVKKYSAPLRTPQGTWARTKVEKAYAFPKHLHHMKLQPTAVNVPPACEAAL